MKILRRALYGQAVLSVSLGLALTVAPGTVLDLVGQPGAAGILPRLLGIHAIGFGLMQTIIGHRVETLWWFSWTFVLVAAGGVVVAALHALVGLNSGGAAWPWWGLAGLMSLTAVATLVGLARAGLERPAE